jgi:hypothetical protein
MNECVSMYLGGDIIKAAECGFDDYRRLGLLCPFCKQPVFLRAGHLRTFRGTQKPVSAYFAHYAGSGEFDDCEKRYQTAQGQALLAKLRTERHNQRLELFNKRLWEIISEDQRVSLHGVSKQIEHKFGRETIDNLAKLSRCYWREAINLFQDMIVQQCNALDQSKFSVVSVDANFEGDRFEYFSHDCDMRFHITVCSEVADFLASPKSGYAWQKLTRLALIYLHSQLKQENQLGLLTFKDLSLYPHPNNCESIIPIIGKTRWAVQISKRIS